MAVSLAKDFDGPVCYIATARPSDDEMERRIAGHRDARPSGWNVVEEPVEVETAIASAAPDELVLFDCVTIWIANLMECQEDHVILDRVDQLVVTVTEREATAIVVSNEVGSGLVPMDPVGRRFRDLQGAANQRLATAAETAYLVVAGRALILGDPGGL